MPTARNIVYLKNLLFIESKRSFFLLNRRYMIKVIAIVCIMISISMNFQCTEGIIRVSNKLVIEH
jgi:hypothetical protein